MGVVYFRSAMVMDYPDITYEFNLRRLSQTGFGLSCWACDLFRLECLARLKPNPQVGRRVWPDLPHDHPGVLWLAARCSIGLVIRCPMGIAAIPGPGRFHHRTTACWNISLVYPDRDFPGFAALRGHPCGSRAGVVAARRPPCFKRAGNRPANGKVLPGTGCDGQAAGLSHTVGTVWRLTPIAAGALDFLAEDHGLTIPAGRSSIGKSKWSPTSNFHIDSPFHRFAAEPTWPA
jgi:hypothetical protein